MKTVRITFPNGDMFDIPAAYVARDRANYYAKLDFDRGDVSDWDKAHAEEMEFALKDDYELVDWLSNNMNWSDVSAFAVRVEPEKEAPQYSSWLSNAKKDVIETK